MIDSFGVKTVHLPAIQLREWCISEWPKTNFVDYWKVEGGEGSDTHLLNPGLLLDRCIRRDGDSSGGPLFVLVENGNLGVLVPRRQDQLAFYLRSERKRKRWLLFVICVGKVILFSHVIQESRQSFQRASCPLLVRVVSDDSLEKAAIKIHLSRPDTTFELLTNNVRRLILQTPWTWFREQLLKNLSF